MSHPDIAQGFAAQLNKMCFQNTWNAMGTNMLFEIATSYRI